MEAKELRIGNWVQFRHTETPVLITLADFVREYKEEHLEDYEPIPLTKEWLDKFNMFNGKEYAYGNYPLRMGNYAISDVSDIFDKGWSIGIEGSDGWMFLVCVKYVHQLQNVIFALTGDVLTEK